MYAIYGNIYHQYTPNVSIYTIHGSYGICLPHEYHNFKLVARSIVAAADFRHGASAELPDPCRKVYECDLFPQILRHSQSQQHVGFRPQELDIVHSCSVFQN